VTPPDGCPFHDLDPATTVWVDLDGWKRPYSAELACDNYHLNVAIQPDVDALLAAVDAKTREASP
jgi:hypothetical protein